MERKMTPQEILDLFDQVTRSIENDPIVWARSVLRVETINVYKAVDKLDKIVSDRDLQNQLNFFKDLRRQEFDYSTKEGKKKLEILYEELTRRIHRIEDALEGVDKDSNMQVDLNQVNNKDLIVSDNIVKESANDYCENIGAKVEKYEELIEREDSTLELKKVSMIQSAHAPNAKISEFFSDDELKIFTRYLREKSLINNEELANLRLRGFATKLATICRIVYDEHINNKLGVTIFAKTVGRNYGYEFKDSTSRGWYTKRGFHINVKTEVKRLFGSIE